MLRISHNKTMQRISAIDALRGFSILGILIMNIQSFALPDAAYLNPLINIDDSIGLGSSWSWLSYIVSHVFADQKFMTIFSILFGSSLALLQTKWENKPGRLRYLFNRNIVLLGIGFLHAYFIWHGDILVTYALCGLWVIACLKLSNRTLLLMSMILILMPVVINLILGSLLEFMSASELLEIQNQWRPSESYLQEQIQIMQSQWSMQLAERISAALMMQTELFIFETCWRVTALMLLGVVLFRMNFYTMSKFSFKQKMLIVFLFLLGFFLISMGVFYNDQHQWQAEFVLLYGSLWNYCGSVFMAISYMAIFLMVFYSGVFRSFFECCEPVGKMALSNYLLQSLLGTWVFYGHGLGLFSLFSREMLWLLLPVIWVFQILFSQIWLSRYRYGPLEWLWRSVSLWKMQPMLNKVY